MGSTYWHYSKSISKVGHDNASIKWCSEADKACGLFDGFQSHFSNIPIRHGSCTRLGTLSSTRLGTLSSTRLGTLSSSNACKGMEFISGVYEITGSCCTKSSEERCSLEPAAINLRGWNPPVEGSCIFI